MSTLTPAQLKKREEIAKAIEKDQPGIDMSKKMAIATAQAKKVVHESFAVGKKVYTTHTDSVKAAVILGKDSDNKDHYIVKQDDGKHSVHQDHIHLTKTQAGYMHESTNKHVSFRDFLTVLEAKKHDDTEEDKALIKKMVKPEALKEGETLEEQSPFDILKDPKKYVSQIPKDDVKKTETGTVYKARETPRNPEGGEMEKRGRGRPKGSYGSYKIDKAKRDDPEYKKALSQKIMAAKAENFKIRREFKDAMNDAIKKHQLKLAGLSDK